MAKRIRDTDYLGISARVRAMESALLTRERMEQILEAHSAEEIAKVLQECGYPELNPAYPEEMDAAMTQIRADTLRDLTDSAPDPSLPDLFRIPYDYHNAKAILKAAAMGTDPARMLIDLGRIPAAELRECMDAGELDSLPGKLGPAIAEAKEILDSTRDPQLSDVALDRWTFADLAALAEQSGSAFVQGYVRIRIDAANLRALVRTLRMGKNSAFLRGVLADGGEIDPESMLTVSDNHGTGLAELYAPTALAQAAEAGGEVLKGGTVTEFEKRCDDAVSEYLDRAALIPFGEAPLIAYLAARETEYANLRIVLLGRGANLPADVIRSRLRAGTV